MFRCAPARYWLPFCLILTLPLPRASGQPSPPNNAAPVDRADLELRVQRLLQQLSAGERTERDVAENRLIDLGADCLPLLPTPDDTTAAELRERLLRIRNAVEKASAAAALAPTRFTLEGTYKLPEILRQLEQQTGNRVVDFSDRFGQPALDRSLSIEFQEMEFWKALDLILDQAGMTTYNYSGEVRTLAVNPRSERERARARAASYAGVFRIEAAEIQSQRNLRNQDDGTLRIRLEILWEPRLLPVTIRHAFRDVTLVGDDGSSIEPAQTEGVADIPVQSTVAGVDLVMPFKLPARSVTRIESFRGRLTAVVPGREEEFLFDNLVDAKELAQQRGGLEVMLDRTRRNGDVFEVRIRLRLMNEGDAFESHLDWAANNVVYLVDKAGNKVDNPNFEQYLERQREVGYAYLFPIAGDAADYQLVYRSPASILTVPVEYELKGIDLP